MPRPRIRYGIMHKLNTVLKNAKSYEEIPKIIKGSMYFYINRNTDPFDYTILNCIYELGQVVKPKKLSEHLRECAENKENGHVLFLQLLRLWRQPELELHFRVLYGVSVQQVIDVHTDLVFQTFSKSQENQENANIEQSA